MRLVVGVGDGRRLDPDALHQPHPRRQRCAARARRRASDACTPGARSRCCRTPRRGASGRGRWSRSWSSSPPCPARSSSECVAGGGDQGDRTLLGAQDSSTASPSPVILTLSVASSRSRANASSARRYSPTSASICVTGGELLAEHVDRRRSSRAGQPRGSSPARPPAWAGDVAHATAAARPGPSAPPASPHQRPDPADVPAITSTRCCRRRSASRQLGVVRHAVRDDAREADRCCPGPTVYRSGPVDERGRSRDVVIQMSSPRWSGRRRTAPPAPA